MPHRLPRKLLCIVHADVAGYSRLIDADEDGTVRALKAAIGAYCAEMQRHGGRIVNRAGDSILVCFDAPYGAVAGAMAAQRAVAAAGRDIPAGARLSFRIGIHIGDVIETGGDTFGHGINVAARIQALAEPGGVCVSEAVAKAVPNGSGVAFEAMGERTLKNIKEPVTIYAVRVSEPSGDIAVGRRGPLPSLESGTAPARLLRKILVLPFTAFSADPQIAYLADGFCEDLITELSRFKSFAVLARTTSFAFKGSTKTIAEIGGEVGADYALEGSLRPVQTMQRINVQLIETANEDHVWAEKYDCGVADLFATQDTIVSRIASILEDRIVERRLRMLTAWGPQMLDAYDCWLKGHALMQNWAVDDDESAIGYFERAIELDPDFARAHASLAGVYSARTVLTPGGSALEADIARALDHAETAVRLDPADGKVYVYLGWVRLLKRQFDGAAGVFERAGACNPNDAEIAIARSLAEAYLGQPQAAAALAELAFVLNPYRPHYYLGYRAVIAFLDGAYGPCVRWFEEMPKVTPPDLLAWFAAGLAMTGQLERAAAVAAEFRHQVAAEWQGAEAPTPVSVLEWFLRITPLRRDGDTERLMTGLRLAGIA